MTYDLNNLIKTVSSQGGQTEYAHLADGTKIWAYDGNTLLAYWGSFVYESRDTVQLESIGYSQGRIVPENGSGGRRTFKNKVYMSDQVGSTRVVLDIDNEESPVVEQNDYLPFGKRAALSGYVTDTTNRYRFNGKEEQAVIGVPYTDYGARLYDTFSARWLSQDPKAENYYGFSPYVFCEDNPVNFVDPNGESWFYNFTTGSFVSYIEDGDDSIYLLTKEQIDEANGDETTLSGYKSMSNKYGQLSLENKINTDVQINIIKDFYKRANVTEEKGNTKYYQEGLLKILINDGPSAFETTGDKLYASRIFTPFEGYEMIGLLSHEIKHQIDIKSGKTKSEKYKTNEGKQEEERSADEFAMNHWSFSKMSAKAKEVILKHYIQSGGKPSR